MFTQTCRKCGKVIEYENQDELKEHFYFKNGYYRKVCKDCEKKEHKEKYASGKYNYNKRTDGSSQYAFGSSTQAGE